MKESINIIGKGVNDDYINIFNDRAYAKDGIILPIYIDSKCIPL
jgi:hypothetical protein